MTFLSKMKIFIFTFCLICFFHSSSQRDQSLGPPKIPDYQNRKQFMWSTYVLTHGVRISAYQAYPTSKTCHVVEANGAVDGIFDYTNSKQRYLGEYSIPDFVEILDEFKKRDTSPTYSVFEHMDSIPTLYSEGFDVENETFFNHLPFLSGAYAQPLIGLCFLQDISVFLQGRYTLKSYEVKMENPTDLINNKRLTKDFFDRIQALPKKYEGNRKEYEKFIKMVGTHYWDWAEFGHVYLLNYNTTPEYFMKESHKEKLKNRITSAATGQTQYNHHGQTTDYYYYGAGLPFENIDDAHRENWKNFYSDKWIIRGNLLLISNLITDSNIKKQVEMATQAYLDHEFLDFVKNGLNFANDLNYTIISPYHYNLLIDANQRLDIPIEDDIKLIKKIVQNSDLLWEIIKCGNFYNNIGVVELCK